MSGSANLVDVDLGVVRRPGIEEFPPSVIPSTPSYMAPGTLGGAAGDERSDLFALSLSIYRPFTGTYTYGGVEPFRLSPLRRD